MNLTDLPLDVIEYISSYLPKIKNLSRSCRRFYYHFLPKFYKYIRLDDTRLNNKDTSLSVFQEFLTVLKSRPYLGQYIKKVIDNLL